MTVYKSEEDLNFFKNIRLWVTQNSNFWQNSKMFEKFITPGPYS